jgi:hypothetical protein
MQSVSEHVSSIVAGSRTYGGGNLLLLGLVPWDLAHNVRVGSQVGIVDGVPFPRVVVVLVGGHRWMDRLADSVDEGR